MKNSKFFLCIIVILIVILGFTSTVFGATKYNIGFDVIHIASWTKKLMDGALEKAKELNVNLEIYNADYKIENQIQQVEDMITQKFDAIIIHSVDYNGSAILVDHAKEAGIPVVEVDTETSSDNRAVFVGANNLEAGEKQAEWILKNLGSDTGGNIAILHGAIGATTQKLRYQGFKEALLDKYPNWKVLVELTANWRRDEAMRITEDWLQSYGDKIDVIIAHSDDMAMGAVQAIKNYGVKTNIKVLGIDAVEDAVQAVKDGEMAMTVFQDPRNLGKKSVEVAVGILEGKTYPERVLIHFVPVTKENADEYLTK